MRARVVCWVAAALLAAAALGRAQAPDKQDEPPVVLGSELVLLDVSVADPQGRPFPGLARERFSVAEDGAPQEISFFDAGTAPASIALLLDTSGSMTSRVSRTAEAAARMLDGARAGDEFAVVAFRDEAHVVQPFTADADAVRAALGRLDTAGQTAMLDALYATSDYAHARASNRLKAVVLVTDGLDGNSFYKLDQVVAHLRGLDVRVYLVGLTADLNAKGGLFSKSEKTKAVDLLAKLAKETGGRAFFPDRVEDLAAIDDAIAADLRSVYAIGYYPKNEKRDGAFRRVDVRVAPAPGEPALTVRTRAGYVAPSS